MQLYDCRVRHANAPQMVIAKEGVTAAEIMLLRHLHTAEAVTNIVPTREARLQQAKERDRLVQSFGAKVFAAVFPGTMPRLPVNLTEAGLREDGSDPEADRALEDDADEPLPEPSAAAKAIAEKVKAQGGKPVSAGLT